MGIVAGIIVVAYITISGSTIGTLFPSLPQQMKDINVGFIALLVNFIVMWAVSMLTKQNEAGTKVC
ncbi:hypothetical protein AAAC51_31840 [Priestia megaterium]